MEQFQRLREFVASATDRINPAALLEFVDLDNPDVFNWLRELQTNLRQEKQQTKTEAETAQQQKNAVKEQLAAQALDLLSDITGLHGDCLDNKRVRDDCLEFVHMHGMYEHISL